MKEHKFKVGDKAMYASRVVEVLEVDNTDGKADFLIVIKEEKDSIIHGEYWVSAETLKPLPVKQEDILRIGDKVLYKGKEAVIKSLSHVSNMVEIINGLGSCWVNRTELNSIPKEETTLLDRLIKAGLKDSKFYKEFEQKEKVEKLAFWLMDEVEKSINSNYKIEPNHCVRIVNEMIEKLN